MSLPDVEWSTNYPGSQDPDDNSKQPDLTNESTPGAGDGHNTRVSQILALRNKLQAACKLIGDNNRLPSTSIMKRVWDLENNPPASPPSGAASGQLSGTYPGPSVAGITETDGPTALTIGAIADGKFLKRSGGDIVGADDTVGAVVFTELTDVFSDYTGKASDLLRVKSSEDGVESLKCNLTATSDPTANDGADDGYSVSSLWFRVDAGNEKVFVCLKNDDPDQAIWQDVGGGGASSLDTAYDGGDNITVDGNPVTLNRTQTADDQESFEINHDFDDSKGTIVKITGTNTGDGTANLERITISEATITKKIPTTEYWYALSNDRTLIRKEGTGAWESFYSFASELYSAHAIKGIDVDDIYVTGKTPDQSKGRLVHYNGSTWTTQSNLESVIAAGVGANTTNSALWLESPTEIYYVGYHTYGNGLYIVRGDGADNWTDLDSAHVGLGDNNHAAKLGNQFVVTGNNGIRYTDDISVPSPVWAADTSLSAFYSGSARIGIATDAGNNRFICSVVGSFTGAGQVRFYYGFPGSWTELARFEAVPLNNIYGGVWVSSVGEVFMNVNSYSWPTPRNRLMYDIETGTPQVIGLGTNDDASGKRIYGLSGDSILIPGSSGRLYKWNGSTIEEINTNPPAASHWYATFGVASSVGTATFGGHKVSFTGLDVPNEAVAYEVGAGATHALKAASGSVELSSGTVILGELTETPATPINAGVLYTKQVSGETEGFYLGTDGNEIQLTSGGNLIAGGLRESGGQELVMGAITDGQFFKRSGTDVVSEAITVTMDGAYDGTGGGAGRTVAVDSDAVVLNADGNAALQVTSANGLGTDDALVELTHTQEAGNKPVQKITHDFNSNQGAAVEFSGVNTGDGTPNGESIKFISAEVEKKVPALVSIYALGDNNVLRSKQGTDPWGNETLPNGPTGLRCINGTGLDNIWVCAGIGNATAYIAVDDGTGFARVGSGGAHPTFGTHPYDGQPAENGMEWVWPVSKTEIWTVTYTWSAGNRYHKWDPTNGWVQKHLAPNGGFFELVSVGNYFSCSQNSGDIIYSDDGGETWNTDSTFSGNAVKNWPNLASGKIVILTRTAGGVARVYDGYPGGSWSLVGEFTTGWGAVDPKNVFVSEDGKVFAVVNSGGSVKFVHSWETTPVGVDLQDWAGGYLKGISSNYILIQKSTSEIYTWDGASLTSQSTGASTNVDCWANSSPTGTGKFSVIEAGFTGSAGTNQAVAFKGGVGVTHALHADSGVVTLTSADDPATETGKGSFYTKEAGGASEAHFKDGGGNVSQLTSGGKVLAGAIAETAGPTNLTVGDVNDGEFLKRSGSEVVSEALVIPSTLDDVYDGGGSGAGRTVTVDSEAVALNADGNAALKATSANGVGTDDALVELTHTQEADYKPTQKITHDFNDNQGAAVELAISAGSTGTPNSEEIGALKATVEKKLPSTVFTFVMGSSDVRYQEDEGSWTDPVMENAPDTLKWINGSDESNVWVGGADSGSGYLAVFNGSNFDAINSHPTFGTHPLYGVASATIYSVLPVSTSEIWTNGYDVNAGQVPKIHKWDPTNGWVQKFVGGFQQILYGKMVKVGDEMAVGGGNTRLLYSHDAGETWAFETAQWSGMGYLQVERNEATGRIYVLGYRNYGAGYTTSRLYEGITGGSGPDAWTVIGEHDAGEARLPASQSSGCCLWADTTGNVFALLARDASYSGKIVHSWDTTTVEVDVGGNYAKIIEGISATHILVKSNYGGTLVHRVWDGASFTDFNSGVTNVHNAYIAESLSGTGVFNAIEAAFSGSGGSNDAVAFKVGAGATHAVKALSGKIELEDGVVILGEQSETPATPTNKGIFYTKEVSGETEAFYLGTDGNEIQLTSGGSLTASSIAREQNWSSPGTDALGDPIVFNNDTALEGTPLVAVNMAAGYDIQAFCNGIKMVHQNPPAATNHFYYNNGTNKVELYASGIIDRYELVYRSQS